MLHCPLTITLEGTESDVYICHILTSNVGPRTKGLMTLADHTTSAYETRHL